VKDGDYQITVRLYSDETGTQEIWRDTYLAHVVGGVFSLALGSGTQPLPPSGEIDRGLWLGVQVGVSQEMRPLTAMTATPFALNVPDSSITEKKINADYVRSISINGQKVSSHAADLNIVTGEGLSATLDLATNSIVMKSSGSSTDAKGAKT